MPGRRIARLGILAVFIHAACGGGGGGGPTTPGKGGQDVTAHVTIADAHCNSNAPIVVEVDNRSLDTVYVFGVLAEGTPLRGACKFFGVGRYPGPGQGVAAGARRRLEFEGVPWCCGNGICCGEAPCATGSCDYRIESWVETNLGDLTSTNSFTVEFGPECKRCSR